MNFQRNARANRKKLLFALVRKFCFHFLYFFLYIYMHVFIALSHLKLSTCVFSLIFNFILIFMRIALQLSGCLAPLHTLEFVFFQVIK